MDICCCAADDFIQALPAGYATPLGDAGRGLSAGQVRRIALARALVRDASLLVLDEPTTSLDPVSAQAVADALVALPRSGSMLIATHDMDLAERVADRIVSLRDGRVASVRPGQAPAQLEEWL